MKDHPKLIFAIRLIVFLLASVFAPCIYLIIEFNLFSATTKIQVGLWGIICFIICASVGTVMLKYYLAGMKHKHSFTKQIVVLFLKVVLPILIAILVLSWLRDNINQVVKFLWVLLPCEVVGGVINPLPKWATENEIEGIADSIDKLLERRENNSKSEIK